MARIFYQYVWLLIVQNCIFSRRLLGANTNLKYKKETILLIYELANEIAVITEGKLWIGVAHSFSYSCSWRDF